MNKLIFVVVGFVVVLILAFSSLFIVREGEYKVVLQFGEVVRIHETPGIRMKIPFIEDVTALPKYQMVYDSKPAQIITKDKKPIIVDNYTIWRITEPTKFLRTVQSVAGGESRIDNTVYNVVRRKLSGTDYGNIISEKSELNTRGDLNDDITKEVIAGIERNNYGIKIVDVRIKRTDLPNENKQSVYKRMISDRLSIAARYLSEGDEESKRITSKADREARELLAQAESDAKKIVAEGEQEAAQIYNRAYGKDPQFYKLYRTLESYKVSFEGEPVIMLPIDSPYTNILLGK